MLLVLPGQAKLTDLCLGLGNIIGPLTFRGKDAPDYIPAKIAIVVTAAFACGMTALLMAYYTYENRRRDSLMTGVEHQENSEFLDLTDKENLEFRVSFLISPTRHLVLTEPTVSAIIWARALHVGSNWLHVDWIECLTWCI